jgi:hypothetical protein
VNARCVLDHPEVAVEVGEAEPEVYEGRCAVGEQSAPKIRIDPRPGNRPGADHRPHVVLEPVDDGIDLLGRDDALLDQQGFERLCAQGLFDRARVVIVIVIVAHVSSAAGSR